MYANARRNWSLCTISTARFQVCLNRESRLLATLRCALARCRALSCEEARCGLVEAVMRSLLAGCCESSNVTMTSFFPKPPHLLCPVIVLVSLRFEALLESGEVFLAWFSKVLVTTLYSSLSIAERRTWIESDLFCFRLVDAAWKALELLIFLSWILVVAVEAALSGGGRAIGPREPTEVGCALVGATGA